ncbi:uncharacterized protein K02A2.6-like [Ornithodoros turicata]|uniref:uncharacterized protein K02A2.6-like n=1 Tax=Ornithodoros turicata TaxID=34597 RepID=UPI003139A33A
MRKEVLESLHDPHTGIEKMLRRAREVFYWPHMYLDVNHHVQGCPECQRDMPRNPKQPMLSHESPNYPWQDVSVDLFYHNGTGYVVLVDSYSFFYELRPLRHTTAKDLISVCTVAFATHGLPMVLKSDNGPPSSSAEFTSFLRSVLIKHITSSPRYPRGNGLAERAVREAKRLLKKHAYGAPRYFAALLEWRNQPRDPILRSPAERLMGRHTRTMVPAHQSTLSPRAIPAKRVTERLRELHRRQSVFYNRTARPQRELRPGEAVRLYTSHDKIWAPAVVLGKAAIPRSYFVETEENQLLRRNREALRPETHQPEGPTPREPDSCPGLRRSQRQRREPSRYPAPEF